MQCQSKLIFTTFLAFPHVSYLRAVKTSLLKHHMHRRSRFLNKAQDFLALSQTT